MLDIHILFVPRLRFERFAKAVIRFVQAYLPVSFRAFHRWLDRKGWFDRSPFNVRQKRAYGRLRAGIVRSLAFKRKLYFLTLTSSSESDVIDGEVKPMDDDKLWAVRKLREWR